MLRRRSHRTTLPLPLASVITLLVVPALVRAESETAAILTAVQTAFEELETFERMSEMNTAMMINGQAMNQTMSTTEQAAPPDRHRRSTSIMGMEMMTVSDGETTWTYNSALRQYTEEAVTPIASGETFAIEEASLDRFAEHSTLVGTEPIAVGERTYDAHILEIDPLALPPSPDAKIASVRIWLAGDCPFVLKTEMELSGIKTPLGPTDGTVTYSLERFTADADLAADTFMFTPPDGAKKVDDFQPTTGARRRPPSPLAGKPAPDFTGTTLEGKSVSLGALRGKVVLVDFWATWCGPCRRELPHVQKLHEAYGDGDLVVLAVSAEKKDKIARYVDGAGFTFTCVVDGDRAISSTYGVTSLPTVVIVDRDGNVSSHLIGLRSEDALKSALAQAGLSTD